MIYKSSHPRPLKKTKQNNINKKLYIYIYSGSQTLCYFPVLESHPKGTASIKNMSLTLINKIFNAVFITGSNSILIMQTHFSFPNFLAALICLWPVDLHLCPNRGTLLQVPSFFLN